MAFTYYFWIFLELRVKDNKFNGVSSQSYLIAIHPSATISLKVESKIVCFLHDIVNFTLHQSIEKNTPESFGWGELFS